MFFNDNKKVFKIACKMNVLKAVLHDLKFLFEDACGIFADSDVRFIHATLNNFFKVSKVIVETECYLSFFTGNLETIRKLFGYIR